jgi:peptidylprolyl isomerase
MPSKSSRRRRPRKQKTNYTRIVAIVALLAVVTVVVAYVMLNNDNSTPEEAEEELTQMKVLFETSMGNITLQLRDDMPITTSNFKKLVHDGTYDNTTFHRVIADFMIQGGDPNGNGLSDDGIATIKDEFTATNENNRGTIAMAKLSDASGNRIENSGSSQFFINVVNNNHLDEGYSVFGEVIDGMTVVDDISIVDTDDADRPLEDVVLIRATLID